MAKRAKSTVTAAVGLIATALGLLIALIGAFINNNAVSGGVTTTGISIAVLGAIVALVGIATRLLSQNQQA